MRCLNLCEYCPENNYTFICRKFNKNISEKILNNKYNLIILDYNIEPLLDNYKTWIGKTEQDELNDLIDILKNNNYDKIIIDHYGIDYYIEKELKKYVNKIIVINDIFDYNIYCN
jgi:UDP-2,4-diacetamido-2,4,6-trideoxy-beta-L-altropyranose hydrolase